jgi:hypothetical protein
MTTHILKAISCYTVRCNEKSVAWLKSHDVLELKLAIVCQSDLDFLVIFFSQGQHIIYKIELIAYSNNLDFESFFQIITKKCKFLKHLEVYDYELINLRFMSKLIKQLTFLEKIIIQKRLKYDFHSVEFIYTNNLKTDHKSISIQKLKFNRSSQKLLNFFKLIRGFNDVRLEDMSAITDSLIFLIANNNKNIEVLYLKEQYPNLTCYSVQHLISVSSNLITLCLLDVFNGIPSNLMYALLHGGNNLKTLIINNSEITSRQMAYILHNSLLIEVFSFRECWNINIRSLENYLHYSERSISLFQKFDPFDDDESEESDCGRPYGCKFDPDEYVSDEDSCDGLDQKVLDDEENNSDSDIEDHYSEDSVQFEKFTRDNDEVWKVFFPRSFLIQIICDIILFLKDK